MHHTPALYPLHRVTKPGSPAQRPTGQSAETPGFEAKSGFTRKAAKQKNDKNASQVHLPKGPGLRVFMG